MSTLFNFTLAEAEAREMQDEYGGSFGDARVCPIHPHIKTSSPDGLHDAPCGACEFAMDTECYNGVEVDPALEAGTNTPEAQAAFREETEEFIAQSHRRWARQNELQHDCSHSSWHLENRYGETVKGSTGKMVCNDCKEWLGNL